MSSTATKAKEEAPPRDVPPRDVPPRGAQEAPRLLLAGEEDDGSEPHIYRSID